MRNTDKTNIWWINQYASLAGEPGGSRHVQFAKALQNYNCQTTIVCSSKNYMTGNSSSLAFNDKDKTTHSVQIPTGWWGPGLIGRYLRMVSFGNKIQKAKWSKLLAPPNIIIGSSPSLHAAMGGLKLAKSLGVPFILEIRDLWPASLVDVARVSPSNPIVKKLQKMESVLVHNSDAIITLLQGASEYYGKLGIPADKFDWIPNGVELQQFAKENVSTRDNVCTVMYSGAHGKANGLFTLIEAAGLLQETNPNINFRFVGDGILKPKLKQFAIDNGIHTVVFENAVPRAEMPSVLQEADIFVAQLQDLKIFQHGISPNKIYEYMAASKPIVFGTTAKGNPVIAADVGPIVEPGNPSAVAERIRDICSMKTEERKELGAKGRLFVKQNNTFEVLAKQVNSCIQKVLNK